MISKLCLNFSYFKIHFWSYGTDDQVLHWSFGSSVLKMWHPSLTQKSWHDTFSARSSLHSMQKKKKSAHTHTKHQILEGWQTWGDQKGALFPFRKKKQKWIGCSRWFLYYGGAWRCVHACNARYCSEIAPACICTIVRSHHHAKLPQMAPLLITGNYNRWVSLAVAHTLTFLIYELWPPWPSTKTLFGGSTQPHLCFANSRHLPASAISTKNTGIPSKLTPFITHTGLLLHTLCAGHI
jgi:hypothetical protein